MSDGTGHEGAAWDQTPSWDIHFLNLAKEVSKKSRDPSTKCGCVLVATEGNELLGSGYNGLPRRIAYTDARLKRDIKYQLIVHAEVNAALNAARLGHALDGSTAYITGPPCARCAANLIQAGIRRIVIPEHHNLVRRFKDGDWQDSCDLAREILAEAHVRYCVIAGI